MRGMRRPQFSLRMLLLVTALIAAILGWRVAAKRYNRELRRESHKDERYVLEVTIQDMKGTAEFDGRDEEIKRLQDRLKALDESE